MALRKAGILDTRRDGKYVYYRLADPSVFNLLRYVGELAGMDFEQLPELEATSFLSKCSCPNCTGENLDHTTIAASEGANS